MVEWILRVDTRKATSMDMRKPLKPPRPWKEEGAGQPSLRALWATSSKALLLGLLSALSPCLAPAAAARLSGGPPHPEDLGQSPAQLTAVASGPPRRCPAGSMSYSGGWEAPAHLEKEAEVTGESNSLTPPRFWFSPPLVPPHPVHTFPWPRPSSPSPGFCPRNQAERTLFLEGSRRQGRKKSGGGHG